MKNKKLNLKALQVKSFVTSMNGDSVETVKGGAPDYPTKNCGGGSGGGNDTTQTNDIGCDDPKTFHCTDQTRGQYGCNTYDWGCQSHYPCPETSLCPAV